MDIGGSRNGTSLSEEAQFGGPLGRVPLLGSFFLEPEDIKNVCLGARWNYRKVTGLP
jgi:hypothetical protein